MLGKKISKNLTKASIIKSLAENHCVPANINSVAFPPNLHQENVQEEKHKPSTNKSCGSPKTDEKSINLHKIKSKFNQKINQDLWPNIPQRKKTLIPRDSIVKHVEGWRLNKGMKSTASVRCFPGAKAIAMKHHLKSCLEDSSPDNIKIYQL